MSHNFPYLKDYAFLQKFNKTKLKEQFVKIIVLNLDEKPIQQIQGTVLNGTITIDGSSTLRRTGSINLIANDLTQSDLMSIKSLFALNKKIQILIGFINTTDEYLQYNILWFPQGIFIIFSPNITYNTSGINISLTLHDKMSLLNGECGGTLPASVVFHEVEEVDDKGKTYVKNPTIYQIIQELVNHFGGEQLGKIIINDVPNQIKKVMKWTGSTPLYLYQDINEDGLYEAQVSTNINNLLIEDETKLRTFSYGEDVGYILTDFIYPGELIGNAGDSVCSILDQIKNVLGNYEYFYDLDGNFVFQEIKNYLNKSYSTSLINQLDKNNYLVDYTNGKSIYTFNNSDIIQSLSTTPQYQQIKNDFLIWGKRKSIDGKEVPIRYHLAIDSKPVIGNQYEVFFFIDPEDDIIKAKAPIIVKTLQDRPEKGQAFLFYYVQENKKIYKWNFDIEDYQETSYKLETVTANDYRSQLYFSGVINQAYGLTSNYYYTELKTEWPKIYDIQKQTEKENIHFLDEALNNPSDIDFYLDLIDSSASISEFSVQNIGRRTVTIVDDTINCIFEPDNPDIVIIEKDTDNTEQLRNNCIQQKQEYIQVHSTIYAMLENGGALKSAYEQARKELYLYTSYNEQVSLTILPIYYLQPNSRITIQNIQNNIFGDYMIKSISLPLNIEGTMTLSCTKILERI